MIKAYHLKTPFGEAGAQVSMPVHGMVEIKDLRNGNCIYTDIEVLKSILKKLEEEENEL